jgi:hemolysin III
VQTLEVKPLLRGHFHQAAFFFALGACAMLLAKAHSLHVFVPAFIYALSLSAMFGISALYHRPKWGAEQRVIMKRIDHSAIFILIAGTSTPLFMLALPPELGLHLMIMIWVVAALGVAKCLLWVHSPKGVSAILYVGVGWLAGSNLGAIREAVGPGGFNCLLLGGVLYSIGAFIYAFKWPDPSPKYFGYHEIFHVLVIAAAALQFIAIQPFVR